MKPSTNQPTANALLITTLIMAILVLGGGIFLFTQGNIPGAQALGSTMVGAVLTFFFLHIHGAQTLSSIAGLFGEPATDLAGGLTVVVFPGSATMLAAK